MAISVGFARADDGTPVMREKAHPDSELVFGQDGPTPNQEAWANGWFHDGCEGDVPQRLYSHSTADLK